MGRIVRLRPRGLLGILHLRSGARRLPWVNEVARDCGKMVEFGVLPSAFPAFLDDTDARHGLMLDELTWKRLVTSLFFVEFVTDRHVHEAHDSSRVLAYQCAKCNAAFSSSKGLEQHSRIKHGDRLDIRRFVHSATCPACGTDFRDRLRCIAHLSDRRRPACAIWFKSNVVPLEDQRLLELNSADTLLRREAFKKGCSHHRAKLPAVRRDGRIVGHMA